MSDFKDHLNRQLQNPEFAAEYAQIQAEYEAARAVIAQHSRSTAEREESEDDLFCEMLVNNYLNNQDPEKHRTISIEELAEREGVDLQPQ